MSIRPRRYSISIKNLLRVLVATSALAAFGVVGYASPAFATPKGEYAVFAHCPLSNENVKGCQVARTESGETVIGKTKVSIDDTVTLQGGFGEEAQCEENPAEPGACRMPFFEAANGETLSKTPQQVPGQPVLATLQLAAPAAPASLSPIELSEAALFVPVLSEVFGIPALKLPVKIKLDGPFFGDRCFIGSATEPITLNLITGKTRPSAPNEPINGKIGEESTKAEGGIFVLKNNTLVDNSFAVPRAQGCGIGGSLDGLIDQQLGLPSPAGNNTAILNNTVEQASALIVKAHE